MKLTKKIIFGFTGISLFIIPMLFMVSCDFQSSKNHFDLGISKQIKDYYGDKLGLLNNKKRVMLITAGAKVNDKSFNESTNGALNLYKKQTQSTNNEVTYIETTEDENLNKAYDSAMQQKMEIIVLTGHQQGEMFKKWLNFKENLDIFKKSKAIVVGVDWDGKLFLPEGQFFGLGFNTEEAAWVVGMAASEYLSSKSSPYFSTFGGARFDGVTDFSNGFLQAALDWNNENKSKKIEFRFGDKKSSQITLNTAFWPTAESRKKIEDLLGLGGDESPQIILPVAGSLTYSTLEIIRNKKSNQLVIGVDSNLAVGLPSFASKFFTSIEKKIALAVYKTILMLSGVILDHDNDKGFEADFISVNYQNPKNTFVKYGFEKGFVGYSKSLAIDSIEINFLLNKYFNRFKSHKPIFKSMKSEDQNQDILNKIIVEINS